MPFAILDPAKPYNMQAVSRSTNSANITWNQDGVVQSYSLILEFYTHLWLPDNRTKYELLGLFSGWNYTVNLIAEIGGLHSESLEAFVITCKYWAM